MTELQFCYEVSLDFSSPVHDHAFVLRCLPHDMPEQILLWSELIIQPEPHRISFGGDASETGSLPVSFRSSTTHSATPWRAGHAGTTPSACIFKRR